MTKYSAIQVMRRRLASLHRRADYIKERIDVRKNHTVNYDKAELAAIEWAIELIETHQSDAIELIKQQIPGIELGKESE